MLTREEIDKASKVEVTKLKVAGLGEIGLRQWNGKDREVWSLQIDKHSKAGTVMARACAMSICDGSGNLLYAADQDLEVLNQRPSNQLEFIYNAIMKLNGIGGDAMEEAEKNS